MDLPASKAQRHHRRQGRDAGVDHGANEAHGHLEHGATDGANYPRNIPGWWFDPLVT